MTGRIVTTAHVRSPEIICGNMAYGYEVDVFSAGCTLWEILLGRKMFPNLQSEILRKQEDEKKYMLEQHYYLMGTQLRNYSENKPIARVHRMTFDIVRSLLSRRILEETFSRRFARELKKRKVSSLSKQDLFNIASMINMFIWWFPFERVKNSIKTR